MKRVLCCIKSFDNFEKGQYFQVVFSPKKVTIITLTSKTDLTYEFAKEHFKMPYDVKLHMEDVDTDSQEKDAKSVYDLHIAEIEKVMHIATVNGANAFTQKKAYSECTYIPVFLKIAWQKGYLQALDESRENVEEDTEMVKLCELFVSSLGDIIEQMRTR